MSGTCRKRGLHNAWDRGRPKHIPRNGKVRPQPRTRPTLSPAQRASIVTDHAVVRWLERVTGIDVRATVESEMLADGRDQLIVEMGQGRLHLAAFNVILIIKDGKVLTLVPEDKADG